eukprot:gene6446-16333_t
MTDWQDDPEIILPVLKEEDRKEQKIEESGEQEEKTVKQEDLEEEEKSVEMEEQEEEDEEQEKQDEDDVQGAVHRNSHELLASWAHFFVGVAEGKDNKPLTAKQAARHQISIDQLYEMMLWTIDPKPSQ